MEYELKPCPFCGGEAKVVDQFYVSARYVICEHCGATSSWCLTNEQAVKSWNRRVDTNAN